MVNCISAKNYDDMSSRGAALLEALIKEKPACVLGLATGSTPEGMYALLAKKHREEGLDFSAVTSVNLDEYAGLEGTHEQSYRYFMNKHLFDHVNIDKANTFVPDGTAADTDAECAAYDKRIDDLGGIDLQVLGIGHNGHIGFNEPDDAFTAPTHVVTLKESTIQANARFFDSVDEVPTQALTVGMAAIFKARQILLLAGAEKKAIVEKALTGPITPQVPASLLQLHPNVTVILAEE